MCALGYGAGEAEPFQQVLVFAFGAEQADSCVGQHSYDVSPYTTCSSEGSEKRPG